MATDPAFCTQQHLRILRICVYTLRRRHFGVRCAGHGVLRQLGAEFDCVGVPELVRR